MKRFVGHFVLCLALLLALTGPALAADDPPGLSRIVKTGEFRVGMSGNQPPFTVKNKDGELIGYEVDLANLLAEAMGVKLTIVEKSFAKLLPALEKGEVDAVMSGITMTPERNLKAAFVGPYIISGKSIVTKDTTLAALDDAEEFDQASLTLTALEGSTSQKFVRQFMPRANLIKTANYDEAVRLVLDDKASAMVADFPICILTALRYADDGLVAMTEPMTLEPIGIALPAGDSLMLNMVENYLGALDAVGLLDELEAKWFADSSWLIHVP